MRCHSTLRYKIHDDVEPAERVSSARSGGFVLQLLLEARRGGRAEATKDRRAKSLACGGTGRGSGSAGPQRRRQNHDHEDHHRRGSGDEGQSTDRRPQYQHPHGGRFPADGLLSSARRSVEEHHRARASRVLRRDSRGPVERCRQVGIKGLLILIINIIVI